MNRSATNVAKSSNGKIEIKLFPGSQLGPDEDVLEQARAGAGVAVVVDGGRLGAYVKELGILGAPYVAKDFDELRKLVTSPLFEEWVGKLRNASGHQILSFNWFQGQRHLLTNKPVTKPADLERPAHAHARRAGLARNGARARRDADPDALDRDRILRCSSRRSMRSRRSIRLRSGRSSTSR